MSYQVMANRLAVTNGTDQISNAVPVAGNAAQIDCFIWNLGGATSITIFIEGSNDAVNFTAVSTNAGLVYGPNFPTKTTGIGFAFIRFRYSVTVGSGTVTLYAGVNFSHQ